MKLKTQFLAAVLSFTALGFTLPCAGQGVIYTSRSAFDTAIAGLTGMRRDLDFQGPLPPGGIVQGPDIVRYSSPLTVSGLTFRGGGPLLIRNVTQDNRSLNNYDSLIPLTVEMNGPARAFGADFSSLISPDYSNFLATVTFENGAMFTFPGPANPNFVFFGFVTTQPFSSVTFSDGAVAFGFLHEELLDNITAVVVPEPNVFAIFTVATLLFGRRFGRRQY